MVEADCGRCIEGNRSEEILSFDEMLVRDEPSFDFIFGKVHAMGILLQLEKQFARCRGAVYEGPIVREPVEALQVVGVNMAEEAGFR